MATRWKSRHSRESGNPEGFRQLVPRLRGDDNI